MRQMAREPFIETTYGPAWGMASSALKKPVWGMKQRGLPYGLPWLIILNGLGLFHFRTITGSPLIHRCSMRSHSALLACMFLLAASAAMADSRVFIIANQPDGYGIDQCLARGDKCGAQAARSAGV